MAKSTSLITSCGDDAQCPEALEPREPRRDTREETVVQDEDRERRREHRHERISEWLEPDVRERHEEHLRLVCKQRWRERKVGDAALDDLRVERRAAVDLARATRSLLSVSVGMGLVAAVSYTRRGSTYTVVVLLGSTSGSSCWSRALLADACFFVSFAAFAASGVKFCASSCGLFHAPPNGTRKTKRLYRSGAVLFIVKHAYGHERLAVAFVNNAPEPFTRKHGENGAHALLHARESVLLGSEHFVAGVGAGTVVAVVVVATTLLLLAVSLLFVSARELEPATGKVVASARSPPSLDAATARTCACLWWR